jgi:type VI secretion system protein ImpB
MAQTGGTRQRGRMRAPRVQITYDLDTGGESRRKELPFVLGVLGDFAGQPEKPLPRLRERQFVDVGLGNFHAVMKNMQPRLAVRVDNKLSADESKLAVMLRFESLDDFEPENVAQQVEPLRQLIDVRRQLAALRATLRTQPALRQRLQRILAGAVGNPEQAMPASHRRDGDTR